MHWISRAGEGCLSVTRVTPLMTELAVLGRSSCGEEKNRFQMEAPEKQTLSLKLAVPAPAPAPVPEQAVRLLPIKWSPLTRPDNRTYLKAIKTNDISLIYC